MEYTDVYEEISRSKQGDEKAREYVVEKNIGLVWSIVRKFLNRGHEADDLFQSGSIGLIKAIEKFDESFGVKFSTYAVPMIMGEIKRHIRDDGIIKVSRSLKELSVRARAASDRLSKELCREPSVSEIAEAVGTTSEELVMALDASATPESLNAVVTDDGKELQSVVPCKTDMEQGVVNSLAVKEALGELDVRERQIIVMRYFRDKTQSQIAKMLGISQVQVSRIEKRVLKRMRDKMSG